MTAFDRDKSRDINNFLRADNESRKEKVSTPKSKDCIKRFFGEHKPSIGGAWHDSTDKAYYSSDWFKHYQKMALPFPKSRQPWFMNLADVLHSDDIEKIKASKQIRFHSCGDTGQAVVTALSNEGAVADMMVADLEQDNPPSFFFHLGDIVYSFGEDAYYYEQFYDPYRFYNAPIFAIPGNHDAMIYGADMKSLDGFLKNFCTECPQHAPHAGGLIRSTMNQPGVYWTLDAPFVSIIGLYSNVIDGGPGVISTQGGDFPTVTDIQLDFLASELHRLKHKRKDDPRAIIVAVHHPPFAGDDQNGGSARMSLDLDNAFKQAGLWPDAVLSGHAHHYERFTRIVNDKKIPYLISGSGGYNSLAQPENKKSYPYQVTGMTGVTLENILAEYGYLDIISNAEKRTLSITFNSTNTKLGKSGVGVDSVVVPW